MHHAFISYARADAKLVDEVIAWLERAGVSHWIDRRDIPISTPWLNEIEQAIDASDLVVYLASSRWRASANCIAERELAEERAKRTLMMELDESLDPRQIAMRIEVALAEVPAQERRRTDLLVLAGDWNRGGRKQSELVRGRQLSRLAAVAQLDCETGVPTYVRAFVNASVRARWRRLILGGAGSTLLVLAIGGIIVLLLASVRVSHQADLINARLQANLLTETIFDEDPYRALAVAASLVESNPGDYHAREILVDALATPVPRARVEGTDRLSGFTAGSRYQVGNPKRSGIITLRKPESGKLHRRLNIGGVPTALALSPDNRVVAAAMANGEINLVDVDSGDMRTKLRGSKARVDELRFSADGSHLAAAVEGDDLLAWRWRQADVILDRPGTWFVGLTPVLPGNRMVAVGRDGELIWLDLAGGRVLRERRSSASSVIGNQLSPAGTHLALGSPDQVVIHQLNSADEWEIETPDCYASDLDFDENGLLYAACVNGDVLVIRPDKGRGAVVRRIEVGGAGSMSLSVHPSGEILIGSAFQGILTVAAGEDHAEPIDQVLSGTNETGTPDPGRVYQVSASGDGSWVSFAGEGVGRSWSTLIGRPEINEWYIPVMSPTTAAESRALTFSPSTSRLAIGMSNGDLEVFSIPGIAPVARPQGLVGSVRGIQFTPDENALVAATSAGQVYRVDICRECASSPVLLNEAASRLRKAKQLRLAPQSLSISTGADLEAGESEE